MFRTTIIVSPVLLMLATTISAREETGPLPEASVVESIVIKFKHRDYKDRVEFTASADDWKAIRKGLLPAKRDDNPKKWEAFGSVTVIEKNRKEHYIRLYATPEKNPGAFAIGKDYKNRDYYRGGKSPELAKAVYAAYEKYRENIE